MPLPTPDEILQEVPKQRAIAIQPWGAAQLADVWIALQHNIRESIAKKGKPGPSRISLKEPASAHNPT